MPTRAFILLCLIALSAPIHAQQLQPKKATEALTVRHSPSPTAGYLWRRPDKRIRYKWPYRTEVRNNLDVSLQITQFGFYCYINGKWVLENLPGPLYTSAEFSESYDDGDSTVDGWIPPGKVAIDAENWNTWWPPAPPSCKWAYTAQDSAGNVYHAEEEIGLTPEFYRFHAGDDPAAAGLWAKPEFDDSAWEQNQFTDFAYYDRPRRGWLRGALEVDSTLWNVPLGISIGYVGAVEFYLDGKLLYQIGNLGTSIEDEQANVCCRGSPDPRIITFPRPIQVTGATSRHVLAIRYSSFTLDLPAWSDNRPHLGFRIGDYEEMTARRDNVQKKGSRHQMFLMGVFLSFALLHLVLFLFYPQLRANLYVAAAGFSVAFVVYYVMAEVTFIAGSATQFVWYLRMSDLMAGVGYISFMLFIYSIINVRPSWFFYLLLGLTIIFVFHDWNRPFMPTWEDYLGLAIFLEILRAVIVARIRRHKSAYEGTWILLIGVAPIIIVYGYMYLSNLNVLPNLWNDVDFPAQFYCILLFVISASVFLSRNFARINKNLEAQLIQVKALSEKAIQQEREKAQLEAENARKTKELEEARQLQLSMLPKTVPKLPHLDIAVYSKPAAEVGGDYYDFHLDGDGTLTIAIGDATGHGMKAGTMVSIAKSLFKSLAHEDSLPHIFHQMSRTIASMNLGFLYMAMTLVKVNQNKVKLSAAGMPPALVYKIEENKVDEIVLKGVPLGGFPNFPYQQKEMELNPGDTLVLMSDGLPERFNQAGEIMDYPGARKLVEEVAHASPQAIIDYLVAAGEKWANGRAQEDDVTFVVVKVKNEL
jgi:serine phosphatase RsbU (regulator of sigma subunit)